jgi:hypothetical protein
LRGAAAGLRSGDGDGFENERRNDEFCGFGSEVG